MNVTLIQEAAKHLQITGMLLWSSETELDDDFDPRVQLPPDLSVNLQWGPQRSALKEYHDPDGAKNRMWSLWFRTEAKLLKSAESGPDGPFHARLAAVFLIQYQLAEHWPENQEALHEFGQHNVAIHVWPIWREWLLNTSLRMGVPPLMVPMHMPKPTTPRAESAVDKQD